MPAVPSARGHEQIEHTADVGLRVWAPELTGLFEEAATALVAVMGAGAGPAARTERILLDAPDLEALFVDWLSELLFLFEARDFVPSAASVRVEEEPLRLEAELSGGDRRGFVQHGPAVKAVTYHGLEIKWTDRGYQARVYLDV